MGAAIAFGCVKAQPLNLRGELISLAVSFADALNKILKSVSVERLSQNP